jgi:hypothetical protein
MLYNACGWRRKLVCPVPLDTSQCLRGTEGDSIMFKRFSAAPGLLFGGGLALGLMAGVGMLVGAMVVSWSSRPTITLPDTPLFATASNSGDNMIMATGDIDEGAEGLYVLDCLTGDLQCWVIDPRTGVFAGTFVHNVLEDLATKEGKLSFAMVTGSIDAPRGGGASRPANSAVYVADCNSGNVAMYTIMWNRTMAATAKPQAGGLVRIAVGKGRTALRRDQ